MRLIKNDHMKSYASSEGIDLTSRHGGKVEAL